MIPRDYILEWRKEAPWPQDFQVEQDLIISRALVEIFSHRVTFVYHMDSEDAPPIPLRLKVEVNTREHFSVYGLKDIPFSVASRWFEGSCSIHTYELDELLGTKLRALYQRKWGRDLFDLATALKRPDLDPARVVAACQRYLEHEGHHVTRAQYEENLALKLEDKEFLGDIGPLLAIGPEWNPSAAGRRVSSRFIALLPGEPWKGRS